MVKVLNPLQGVYQLDLEPGGFTNLVSVYLVDTGRGFIMFEGGPAVTSNEMLSATRSLRANVTHVFLTHVHIDHYGGSGIIGLLNPGVEYYVHPRGSKALRNPDIVWVPAREAMGWLGELYGKPLEVSQGSIRETRDGDVITIGDVTVEVVHTPGHASHHQSFIIKPHDLLVVGDAAGIYVKELDYVIPTTMEPLRLDMYIESIKKLIARNPRYIAYTHHLIVPNATELLSRHLRQVEVWRGAIEEAVREGLSVDDAEKLLIERDDGLRGVYERLRSMRAHYHLFRMAIDGLYKYIKGGRTG
ncbi:MBL fold metallo-hydrolase [Vulcanisaeta thermophila]|uniref:MBL fold metallo-hydrolase n=1 Tax=Vulcanisaeta thermophila TaxID=867917 RepID=UPI0008531AEB|nr:MBL fold metallo-hydrolase [Vulcanisaeta thermophila]